MNIFLLQFFVSDLVFLLLVFVFEPVIKELRGVKYFREQKVEQTPEFM